MRISIINKANQFIGNLKNRKVENVALLVILLFGVFALVFSLFRAPTADETIYLLDTAHIAYALKHGDWIGSAPVGLHGVLFKIPIALIFIFTGPSVFLATLSTILLACLSGWLFFKILFDFFRLRWWAIGGLLLLIANYHFIGSVSTYLREIPLLFAFLLALRGILYKHNYWVQGIWFLLLLDAKEYGFYAIVPAYLLGLIFLESRKVELPIISRFRNVYRAIVPILSPALVYLVFSFVTQIIPLNPYNISILGLEAQNVNSSVASTPWAFGSFNFETATANLLETENVRTIPQISSPTLGSQLSLLVKAINFVLAYLGKLLYPRTFSLIGIPKIVILPAVVMSFVLFQRREQKNRDLFLLLSFIFWFYLILYIARTSHSRYFFAMTPVTIIYFILFIIQFAPEKKLFLSIWLMTVGYAIAGLYFEVSFVPLKILFDAVVLFLMFVNWYMKKHKEAMVVYVQSVLLIFLICSMFLTAIAASLKIGQMMRSMLFGQNYEMEQILYFVNKDEKTWINGYEMWTLLPSFYLNDVGAMSNIYLKWLPPDWLHRNLAFVQNPIIYSFPIISIDRFTNALENFGISRIILVYSSQSDVVFSDQEMLRDLLTSPRFVLEHAIPLLGKTVYYFGFN